MTKFENRPLKPTNLLKINNLQERKTALTPCPGTRGSIFGARTVLSSLLT